jgi:hypothetical protein
MLMMRSKDNWDKGSRNGRIFGESLNTPRDRQKCNRWDCYGHCRLGMCYDDLGLPMVCVKHIVVLSFTVNLQ